MPCSLQQLSDISFTFDEHSANQDVKLDLISTNSIISGSITIQKGTFHPGKCQNVKDVKKKKREALL